MQLANQIAMAFVNPPGPGYEQVFADALAAFVNTTLQKKRAIAVSAVATRAAEFLEGRRSIGQLVVDLTATDKFFAVLALQPDELVARVKLFDPAPKINSEKKSAEAILAGFIVDLVGRPVLGFPDPSVYAEAFDEPIEEVRKRLARDLSKFISSG
ncbi:MAG TPA: hypothetical protein VK550_24095 [Polyangiaceae bacterium]|nr:hypothetical protein [Polyangiaceae bacterium]